ncbi:DUF5320 domain-containing protein [candidate division KSB1 bacterium]|nr:DUF5320 domain-containing protein [candidate division KSB1 bacterium]MBL7094374.1 DUF5320 domain-containing protein [candidate division KSB1 bacterium]
MPGGDRTGPRGMGSMTGRGAGYCAGYNVPGYATPGFGRGGGFGGGGRGHRNMYYYTGLPGWVRYGEAPFVAPYGAQPLASQTTPEQELDYLKYQAKYFQDSLENINKLISEMEEKTGK